MVTEDPNTAKSRSGYVITYHGVPLVWASRLQTVFALSTAEAEYISLSTALRDVIPMMDLLAEMADKGFQVQSKPTVHCKLFEDNSGALEQARVAKYRQRMRHINAAWHHFRSYVVDKLISILPVDTKSQTGRTGRFHSVPQDHIRMVTFSRSKRRSERILDFNRA